ncbi:RNA 2',3'-cyclic phosphodiesterase [Nocardioides caldifontis]|uniref:RNA 2',3'-cyclic phosphodiesterase n=1 Tax=Nocardioides caldifontis TaxID=2588938 RepID=UPI0011DFF085|nr:RNA 2',3'-cyclic phosphodiesterase [Nocardioides caldifontis]
MFVAVVPPEDVLEELEEFLAPRREAEALRWTRPESWHLTLAFMASVPDRAYDDLVERLTRAGRKRTPFTVSLGGGGAFPNVGRAKVLYAGVAGEPDALEELRRLAAGARAAAGKAGAPVDGSAFRPHVTLARMSRPIEATRWIRVLSAYLSRPFQVEEMVLVQSFLGEGPGGRPRYETVAEFALGGGAEEPREPSG